MERKDDRLVNITELRMLLWMRGVSLRDHRRNEEIGKTVTVQHTLCRSDYAGTDM